MFSSLTAVLPFVEQAMDQIFVMLGLKSNYNPQLQVEYEEGAVHNILMRHTYHFGN